jgi:hypothetical protein
MLGAQCLWAGRDLYRATPAVTRGLGFSGLIRRTAPFSRRLQHTRGCGGSILTRILMGYWQCDSCSKPSFELLKTWNCTQRRSDGQLRRFHVRKTWNAQIADASRKILYLCAIHTFTRLLGSVTGP